MRRRLRAATTLGVMAGLLVTAGGIQATSAVVDGLGRVRHPGQRRNDDHHDHNHDDHDPAAR